MLVVHWSHLGPRSYPLDSLPPDWQQTLERLSTSWILHPPVLQPSSVQESGTPKLAGATETPKELGNSSAK